MNESMQFEFYIKDISIDERISDCLVTETVDQKVAICEVLRAFERDNALISADIIQMVSTLQAMEKCFFLRVNDTIENCKNSMVSFAQWCINKTNPKIKIPSWSYLFLKGTSSLKMNEIEESFECLLEALKGSNNYNLNFSTYIKIDDTIMQPSNIEISVIFCRKHS